MEPTQALLALGLALLGGALLPVYWIVRRDRINNRMVMDRQKRVMALFPRFPDSI